MAQGKRPDVDGLAALAAWSGLSADDFVRSDSRRPSPEPLAVISTYLRSDKNLSPEAATALDELIKATYERLRTKAYGTSMSYRRGFKTEATDLAREVRAEIGLRPLDRLDPRLLAAHLEIPIIGLSEFAAGTPNVAYFINGEPGAFSALTVFCGPSRTIVHNDSHAPARQSSNLAHELSHGLLLHPPSPALDDHGCRNWNQGIEDEAQWLAGELLVTFEAAMAVARKQWTMAEASQRLGVSEEMVRFRVNMTGANKIVQRAAASGGGR
jgi:hypothetical protein